MYNDHNEPVFGHMMVVCKSWNPMGICTHTIHSVTLVLHVTYSGTHLCNCWLPSEQFTALVLVEISPNGNDRVQCAIVGDFGLWYNVDKVAIFNLMP